MELITVFTPTFNRAYILPQLYESLLRQNNKNFIWLIIDDGSSDNTNELVQSWINSNIINIQYHYKVNGGMHTAHNLAYNLINTELNMCIDSDDYLIDNAIEKILTFWGKNKKDSVGAIYALDATKNNKILGEKYPSDLKKFQGWGFEIVIITIIKFIKS